MSTLSTNWPNLLDLARISDPNGSVQTDIIEALNQTNDVLDDMVWVEGNLPTGHKTTIRSGIPMPTWRKMYGGVQPNKSTTVQVTDTTGMLEAFSEIDVALADLNGNSPRWRASEDAAHMQGMYQTVASTIFYGNEATAPETFTGLAPRFNSLSAQNGSNIIDAGGTGNDNTSIWLVVWGPQTCHGIIPKNSKAGLQMEDMGRVVIENIDGQGGRMVAYRTHYRWDVGLTVRDWRYIVRIANIDKSDLTKDNATGADITDLMTQAIELLPGGYTGMGRPAFYVTQRVRSFLRRQIVNKVKGSTLTMDMIAGKQVVSFDGIPVRRVDAMYADEARVV